MDKKLILAVAGSGKTSYILDQLNLDRRYLVITYTISNTKNIRNRITNRFGYFPSNISLYSYYPFLYSLCFKPFLAYKSKATGIHWDKPPDWTRGLHVDSKKRYFTNKNKLYHNRIAKYLEVKGVLEDVNARLEKHFDCLLIDEVQDLAGHDFNFLKSIATANIDIIAVGDFFQHTFDTSRDGNVNKNLHDDISRYTKKFETMGFDIDSISLDKSYRCSPTVCSYISDNIGIEISSHCADHTNVRIVQDREEAEQIFNDSEIVKLFYQEHYKYNCRSRNWGECKGEDEYKDVCVVINPATQKILDQGTPENFSPTTRNKFYVACSRTRGDLYLVSQVLVRHMKRAIS